MRCLATIIALMLAAMPAAAQKPPANGINPLLTNARSWAYQLQHVEVGVIARSPFDIIVIDYSRTGEERGRFTPEEVRRMKQKPDGSERLLLAYMSIGEAEEYRFYWDERWIETAAAEVSAAAPSTDPKGAPAPAKPVVQPPAASAPAIQGKNSAAARSATAPQKVDRWLAKDAPSWLGDENEAWSGNFEVKFWEQDWHDIIYRGPQSYLERIIAAGFDGVYLDRVDAFYNFVDNRPSATDEMVDFVAAVASRARRLKPGFVIVSQNGEELLNNKTFLASIDGIAKEDLFYGTPDEGMPNARAQIETSLGWLALATAAGRRVLVVEYIDEPTLVNWARNELSQRKFLSYFAPRALDRLAVLPVPGTPRTGAAPTPPDTGTIETNSARSRSGSRSR